MDINLLDAINSVQKEEELAREEEEEKKTEELRKVPLPSIQNLNGTFLFPKLVVRNGSIQLAMRGF